MEAMTGFVDAYRDDHGVMSETCGRTGRICRTPEIAPSTYHERVRCREHPETASLRARRDVRLMQEIKRVFEENFQVYGARKI